MATPVRVYTVTLGRAAERRIVGEVAAMNNRVIHTTAIFEDPTLALAAARCWATEHGYAPRIEHSEQRLEDSQS